MFPEPQSIAETAPKAIQAKQAGANAKEAGNKAKAVNLDVQKIMSALKIKPNKADEAKVSGAEAKKASEATKEAAAATKEATAGARIAAAIA